MALVPIRVDRTSKPPIGTPLRCDGHWSVQGLVGAWAFNEYGGGPVGGLLGLQASLIGATWRPEGLRCTSVNERAVTNAPLLAPIDDKWSIVLSISKDNNTDLPYALCSSVGDAQNNASIYFRSGVQLSIFGVSYTNTVWNSADAIDQAGDHVWGFTRNGAGKYIAAYKDGVSLGNSSTNTLVNNWINFKSIGSRINGNGITFRALITYHCSLSPSQIASLSANPWQIYEPETVWIEVGGGGEDNPFSGAIYGKSSASANLSTAVVLAAAAQGSSTAQAALSIALELAAQVNGIGSATGSLGADISGLAGSLHGSSEAQATLSTAIHLMGLAAGQCVASGRLAEPVEILAQLRVMASDPLALAISVRDPLALRVTVH